MRRTVLFDLDGTVTDSREGIVRSMLRGLEGVGIGGIDPAPLARYIGMPLREVFASEFGLRDDATTEAIRLFDAYYTETGMFENALYPGIDGLLRGLRAAGTTVLLATSKPTAYAETILRHFGIDGLFDFIGGSEIDGTRAGKAAVIRHAMAAVDADDPDAVLVGDSRYDVLGAHEAGIACVGVLYGYDREDALREAGVDWLVPTVAALGDCLRTI